MLDDENFIIKDCVLINYCGDGGDVVVPEGVKKIGHNAFSRCKSLASVSLPKGLTGIGYRAFSECESLVSVSLPEGLTSIDERAFSHCSSLKSINIPDGVNSIGASAFYACESLTAITIPDSVTKIGEDAFAKCLSLESLEINNITRIDVARDFIWGSPLVFDNDLTDDSFAVSAFDMAKYEIEVLQIGYNGTLVDFDSGRRESYTPSSCVVVTAITCEKNAESLALPAYGSDCSETSSPVTHVGYENGFIPKHEEWHDWHHCRGGQIRPDEYTLNPICLNLPSSIKTIHIPETVINISSKAFSNLEDVTFSVHPDNPKYTTFKGKLVHKHKY